ncbi:MAG: hypothetical protein R3D97_12460 [Paracoccaceae bacterium]
MASFALARLEKAERQALEEIAIRERLRLLLAGAMTARAPGAGALPLDGTPLTLRQGDRDWTLALNDVAGLVDIYFASPAMLALLPDHGVQIASGREGVAAALGHGGRYPVLEQSLALFGLDRAARHDVAGFVTQSGRSGRINPAVALEGLRAQLAGLPPAETAAGQAERVQIGLWSD